MMGLPDLANGTSWDAIYNIQDPRVLKEIAPEKRAFYGAFLQAWGGTKH